MLASLPQSWMYTSDNDPDINWWDAGVQPSVRTLWQRFGKQGLTGIGTYIGHDPHASLATDCFFPMGGWENRAQDGARCPAGIPQGWALFFWAAENLISLNGTYIVYCQHIFNTAIDNPSVLRAKDRNQLRVLKVRTDDPRGGGQVANHGDHNHISYRAGASTNRYAAMPVIRQGSTQRAAVYALQQGLRSAFSSTLAVDGDFGPATDRTVRSFQLSPLGGALYADGVVGPQTWRKLDQILDWQYKLA